MSLDPEIRTAPGGRVEIALPFPADWAAAMGSNHEVWRLADWMHSTLVALAWNRMDDKRTTSEWGSVLFDMERLLPRLEAIRAAVIRQHEAAGGSVRDLAIHMDAPKSTAHDARVGARDLNRPFTSWVSQRPDTAPAEPGSPRWRAEQEARLRRAIAKGDADLFREVAQAANAAGIHPNDLLTGAAEGVDTTNQTEAQESVVLHTAILWLLSHQLNHPSENSRASYLKLTDRVERARAVVRLYSTVTPRSLGEAKEEDRAVIAEAYELASRIVNEATEAASVVAALGGLIEDTSKSLEDENADRQMLLENLLTELSKLTGD